MYTDNELQISNKSFTSKDFNTIYPELLDLVKKLTNKWDPTTSNESDPGVVLLKLWSILADKNNYNIDKNILETFPLSVTQLANAHKLYDMLGYRMHYYQSAVTTLNLWYIGTDLPDAMNNITIPKYTMVTDDSGQTVYTITEDVTFAAKNTLQAVQAIQGTIMDYEVNGVSTVTLDNLDSEYRLFFTERMIAENGIFISNKTKFGTQSGAVWKQVDNLESYQLNSKIFKFGVMPNSNTCYIQFPQDIGTLIESGLSIKYVITAGSAGNIQKEVLTTLYEDVVPKEFYLLGEESELYSKAINADIIIKNPNPVSNGKDPEDIDSAYRNYKKTVGTFKTLVTTEDYEKAIFNLDDGLGQPLASNAVVSDRTNDINHSIVVKETTSAGVQDLVYPADSTNAMTAFDIGLYVLEPMQDIYTDYYYNKSFSVHSRQMDILDGISDCKSVGHDYIDTTSESDEPFIFKNFYTLTGKVTTFYKVTQEQAEEIEKNIMSALYKKFNARNVDFGQAINYDVIIKTIQEADTRINSVILNEPEYDVRYMTNQDFSGTYDKSKPLIDYSAEESGGTVDYSLVAKLLAQMIVGGHVQLYKFNTDIEFDFGQTDIVAYNDVTSVTTVNAVATSAIVKNDSQTATQTTVAGGGYIVQKNQNIQLVAPSLYAKTAYTAYVNYKLSGWTAAGKYESEKEAQALFQNKYYVTDNDNTLEIQYTDSNNVNQYRKYGSVGAKNGRAIFRYKNTNDAETTLKFNPEVTLEKEVDGTKINMGTLVSTEQIEIMEINDVILDDPSISCIWFTNTQEKTKDTIKYTLFSAGETQRILQENEYFMYTNKDKDELVIVGSGTLIVRDAASAHTALIMENNLKVEEVVENGQSAIADIDWYKLNGTTNKITLVELQIITLGEGAALKTDMSTFTVTPTLVSSFKVIPTTHISTAKASSRRDPNTESAQAGTVYKVTPKNNITSGTIVLELSGLDTTSVVSNTVYFAFPNDSISETKSAYLNELELVKCTTSKTNELSFTESETTYYWYKAAIKGGKSNFSIKFKNTLSTSFYFSAAAYKEGNYLTNTLTPIIKPQYAEDAETASWVELDDYSALRAAGLGKPYNIGWSCMSRYNVAVNSQSAQDIIKIKNGDTVDTNSNQAIKLAKTEQIQGVEVQSVLLPCIEGKKLLSNTIFNFAGGTNISVGTTDKKKKEKAVINMYAYIEEALPFQDYQDKTVRYTRSGDYIDVGYNTSHELNTNSANTRTDLFFPLSFGPVATTSDTLGSVPSIRYRIPIALSGRFTEATVKVMKITGTGASRSVKESENTADIYSLVALPTGNTEVSAAVISYEGNDFAGIKITSWTKTSTDDVDYEAIQDVLRIGKPRIQYVSESSSKYSDQLTDTIKFLTNTSTSTNADALTAALEAQLAKDGYKAFDTSWIVQSEDAIDTDLSTEAQKYNLFNGLALWDSNHICNKYTIAQLNTSSSAIKVSTLSIKK